MEEETKNLSEKPSEIREKPREDEDLAKKEKPPKKPGAVYRFFNQFGIGKYWERMNEYLEHEEKMEAAVAEKEAGKETAESMRVVGEEAVGEIKARGAEIPSRIEESAARAGASAAEAAPIVAEARAEEERVEQVAQEAADELVEAAVSLAEAETFDDIEIIEEKPLFGEMAEQIKKKYEKSSLQEIDKRMNILGEKRRELDARHEEIEQGLKAGKIFKSDKLASEQENMKEAEDLIRAEADVLSKIAEEKKKMAKDLVPAEEFEEITEAYEKKREETEEPKVEEKTLSQEVLVDSGLKIGDKVQVVLDSGKLDKDWRLVSVGADKKILLGKKSEEGEIMFKNFDLEDLKSWQKIDEEMAEKMIHPVSLGERKGVAETPPSPEEVQSVEVLEEEVVEPLPELEDVEFSEAERKKILAGAWAPKISAGFKARLPDLSSVMETVFFAKGEKDSRERIEQMVNSLARVGEAYVAQKTARGMSAADERALKKWITKTKGAIEVIKRAPPEKMKPVKVVELKNRKQIANGSRPARNKG